MKLTPENYYSPEANRYYMSVSQFKDFLQCEAAALAKLNGWDDEKKDAYVFGSYVHAAIEGTLDQFKIDNPDIFKKDGDLKAEYKIADKMVKAIMEDELCRKMLEGEKEVIVTTDLFGIPWKAKLDVVFVEEGRLTDVKTCRSIRERIWIDEERRYGSFVEAYKYPLQLAVYAEIERLHNKRFEALEPFIVAVSKEDEPDKEVICFDESTLANELMKVQQKLPRIVAVKEGIEEPTRCGSCRYCRQTKKAGIVHYLDLLEVSQ